MLVRTSRAALAVWPSRVTTWVLVRMWPWSSRTMPEPVPPELPLVALMVTTLGDAFSAAAVMALTSSLLLTMTVPGWLPVLAAAEGAVAEEVARTDSGHAAAHEAGGEDARHQGSDAE